MKEINQELKKHIEEIIFPKYDKFYAHGMMHINAVIENMMMLAEYYDLNKDMAYVIACYHDSGLGIDRENHEKESGKILSNDMELKKYFTNKEIKIMQEKYIKKNGIKPKKTE